MSDNEQLEELVGPPLEPGSDERPGAEDATFVPECLAGIEPLRSAGRWTLGEPAISHSGERSDIYRVDFEMPDGSLAPLRNRIVVWRKKSGESEIIVAIGQELRPLSTA